MVTAGILWHEWGEEAFRKAKELKKPILMDISAVWCHWCHVMDQTSYSDKEVIRIVNSSFVAIRVNTDQRPDINRRYNVGGWPSTVFLTPDGGVITGATYVPPDQMRILLRQVSEEFSRSSERRIPKASAKTPTLEVRSDVPRLEPDISDLVTNDVLNAVIRSYDNVYGGFGDQPKFPQPDVVSFVLQEYAISKDQGLQLILTRTLDNMAEGGMYDREEGGFFRYSTRRDWSAPHYEKILEENARLLSIYLDAYQILGKSSYKELAEQIIKYVDSVLSNRPIGGFFGSQDADEEYYRCSSSEREGKSPPKVDKTIYIGQNALMANAYLKASAVLHRQDLREFAGKTINFLLEKCLDKRGIMYHYHNEDGPKSPHLLMDQVQMVHVLLEGCTRFSERSYFQRAIDMTQSMLDVFYDPIAGGFYDTVMEKNPMGALRQREKIIDENSHAAELFLKLYDLTNVEEYSEKAKATLGVFQDTFKAYDVMASCYARAARLLTTPSVKITVVGRQGDANTEALRETSLAFYACRKSVQILDPSIESDRIGALGYQVSEVPTAYVCVGQTCLEPLHDPKELAARVADTAAKV